MPSVRLYTVADGKIADVPMEHLPRKGEMLTLTDAETGRQTAYRAATVEHFVLVTREGALDEGASVVLDFLTGPGPESGHGQ